jgi:hypothetical protein
MVGNVTRLAALLAWLMAPGLVTAQACAPGRVASEQSAGRCCWPGQTWSVADARCDGVPVCPEGFGGDGNTCVVLDAAVSVDVPPPPVAAAPAEVVPTAPTAPTATALAAPRRIAPEPFEALPREAVSPPVSGPRPLNYNVVGGGLALALATYGGSLAEGFIWGGETAYFIPFGALIGAVQSAAYSSVAAATGFAFGLGQIVGTVLMVAGATFFRRAAPVSWASQGLTIAF